jgi:hypothetical protein
MQKTLKDTLAGLVFIAFGLAFAIGALNYNLGSALRMGPGYLPLSLGAILVALGLLVIVEGALVGAAEPIGGVPWRALVLLLVGICFFGFFVRRLGLAPALFVTGLLAAFSSRTMRILPALVIASLLTAFCILLFVKALGMPIVLFGPWLTALWP